MEISEKFFKGLSAEKLQILKEQMQRFEKLKKEERKSVEVGEKIILPEGTLIHGTAFIKDVISSISKTGIITGQYFGQEEDGETYYCADFHRVNKEITLEEYNNEFEYNDGRCPFGIHGSNKGTVAFIILPDEKLDEITAYDCYKEETQEAKKTQEFVNMEGLPISDKSKVSSILYGIPSNFINVIVVSDTEITEENIEFLIQEFPNTFLVRKNGTFLYKVGDTKEVWNLRVESATQAILREQKEIELNNSKKAMNTKNEEMNKLWEAISTLPIEAIAEVYKNLGWQGDYIKVAERLKKQYEKTLQK